MLNHLLSRNICAALLCALSGVHGTLTWESFAYPAQFRGSAVAAGSLWLATPGGIREITSEGRSQLFSSEKGLEYADQGDVFALPDGGLLSVSVHGLIARKNAQGNFQMLNRSYVSADRKLISSRGRLVNSTLILPFTGSLAFFDLKSGKSLLTLVQIGTHRLESHPPSAILAVDDVLYVAVGSAIYKRTMNWDNLSEDRALADPASWIIVAQQPATDTISALGWSGSKLVARLYEGTLEFDSLDRETSACQETGCEIWVNGIRRTDPALFQEGRSLVRWVFQDKERIWFVGDTQAWVEEKGELRHISDWSGFPFSLVHSVAANPAGGVLAWSRGQYIRYTRNGWSSVQTVNTTGYADDVNQNFAQPLKSVAMGSDGSAVFGTWGAGLLSWNAADPPALKGWYSPLGTGCLTGYNGGDYALVRGVSAAPDHSGFLFTYVMPGSSYGLGFLAKDGTISCLPNVGSSSYAGPLTVRSLADGALWDIFVGFGGSLATNVEGGVDWFQARPPQAGTSSFYAEHRQRIESKVGYPRDIGVARDNGPLWVAGASSLGSWESGKENVENVPYLKGYSGGEITALEVDVQGGVWLGTIGKGAYRLTPIGRSHDSLVAEQFLPRNGLLSDRIYDIAIDATSGEVWFGSNVGLSRLRYAPVRDASGYMATGAPAVKVFPNPFRPGVHAQVIFDHVREESVIHLLDASGARIRTFRGNDLKGGRLAWDGTGSRGEPVAPGVYHYWIVADGKTARGKLIVEH